LSSSQSWQRRNEKDLAVQNAQLTQEINEKNQELSQIAKKLRKVELDYAARNRNESSKVLELEQQHRSQAQEITRLEKKNVELNQILANTEQSMGQVSRKYELLENKNRENESELRKDTNAKSKLEKSIQTLQLALVEQKALVSQSKDDLKEAEQKLKTAQKSLTSQLDDANKKLKLSEKKYASDQNQWEAVIQDQSAELKALNKEQAHLKGFLSQTERALNEATKKFEISENAKLNVQKQLDKATQDYEKSNQEIEGLKRNLAEEAAQVTKARDDLWQTQQQYQTANRTLTAQVEEVNRKLNASVRSLEISDVQIKKLSEEVRFTTQEIRELQTVNNVFEKEISNQTSELRELQKQLQSRLGEISSRKDEISNLEKALTETERALGQVTTKHEIAQGSLKNLEETLDKSESTIREIRKDSKQTITQLNARIREFESEVQKLDEGLKSARSISHTRKNQIQGLKQQLINTLDQLESI